MSKCPLSSICLPSEEYQELSKAHATYSSGFVGRYWEYQKGCPDCGTGSIEGLLSFIANVRWAGRADLEMCSALWQGVWLVYMSQDYKHQPFEYDGKKMPLVMLWINKLSCFNSDVSSQKSPMKPNPPVLLLDSGPPDWPVWCRWSLATSNKRRCMLVMGLKEPQARRTTGIRLFILSGTSTPVAVATLLLWGQKLMSGS